MKIMAYAFSWSNEDCTIILDETITLYPNLPKSVGLEVFEDDVSIGYIVSGDNGKGIYEYTPTTIGTHILKYGNIIDCRPLKVIVISPKIYLKVRLDNIFQLISNKVTSWSNKPSNDNYPSEKLVKDSLDNKASIGDLSTVATTGSYNDLSNKPTIPTVPTNISSFNNDSGYITSSSVPNPSSTTPSADTTNGSVGDGTTWARSNHTHPRSSLYAEANHTHDSIYPAYVIDNLNVDDVHYAAGYLHYESFSNAIYYSDFDGIGRIDKELAVKGDLPTIIDNLTTNDATKVLSAKQGKVLNDMIGDDDISAIGDGSVTGAISSLSTSIANLNTRVKSGSVTGVSVQKKSIARYTVTHNLGRPNVPVATLNLGNSGSYAWANTQVSVYDITNNQFKVTIFNNTDSKVTFSFNWVVVATD